jgi:Zn-dependent protease
LISVGRDSGSGSSETNEQTTLRFPLDTLAVEAVEQSLRGWAERSGVQGRILDRLLMAASEVVEAIFTLAAALRVRGDLLIRVQPYSQWITVDLTFPRTVPLDPRFDQDDTSLTEFPGMRVHPDIFWRRMILEWVDKASWQTRGGQVTVSLTQYARRVESPGELYFLGLTPKLAAGVEIRTAGEMALALCSGRQSAYRLTPEARFVLEVADGRTEVRAIYRAFIKQFGLVHPQLVGAIVEDLLEKELLVSGEALWRNKPVSRFRAILSNLLRLQFSLPNPDGLFTAIQRSVGWLWSAPALLIWLAFIGTTLAVIGFRLPPGFSFPFRFSGGSSLDFLLLYLAGFFFSVLVHEFSHGIVLKRLGGKIRAFGVMFYFGIICAFVDTTEAWMFPNRWKRVAISLAGPLSTLVLACLFNWGQELCVRAGATTGALIFNSLTLASLTNALLNLIPFLELDGYYILVDLTDQPNLQNRSFAFLGSVLARLLRRKALPPLPNKTRWLYLVYSLATIAIFFWLFFWPLFLTLLDAARGIFNPLGIFLGVMMLLVLLQLGIQGGLNWYRRNVLVHLDLKARTSG